MNMPFEKLRDISDWLILSALVDRSIEETITSFADKMLDAGLPVHRINCSTFQRHQIMGAVDTTWEKSSGQCTMEFVSKSELAQPSVITRPVGAIARSSSNFARHKLSDPNERAKFELLENLHARGYSDYLILKQSYGRQYDWMDASTESEGVYGTFATMREGGFSDTEIEAIKTLWRPYSLFLKSTIERMLSAKLLEAYVGHLPARNILDGMIERGDGNRVNCALWYSDLRGSTRLSTQLPGDEYLELLNTYFDCTAGSVMKHGGDVLKLIGDAVMAIFPFDRGDASQACSSALAAAHDSLTRAMKLQKEGQSRAATDLYFGIGLHVGEVTLGNVGTPERLDMTVTGPSANQVTRLEALTKPLALSVLASPQFFKAHPDGLVSIGAYPVPDLGGMTEIYSLVKK